MDGDGMPVVLIIFVLLLFLLPVGCAVFEAWEAKEHSREIGVMVKRSKAPKAKRSAKWA